MKKTEPTIFHTPICREKLASRIRSLLHLPPDKPDDDVIIDFMDLAEKCKKTAHHVILDINNPPSIEYLRELASSTRRVQFILMFI